jgi:hypothetical protein
MVNFYSRVLPDCAHVLWPLTDLLKGSPKTLEWTTAAEKIFQDAKRLITKVVPLQHPSKCLLTKAVPLQHPSPQAKLSLATDASDCHNRGIMWQKSLVSPWFLFQKAV